jgi:Alginate export
MRNVLILFFLLLAQNGFSQQFPSFKPLRYDEDYSSLSNDSMNNWYRRLKFNPLSPHKKSYISFGGEARFQYFNTQHEGWGDDPADNNGYILGRLLFHVDLHIRPHFRTFVQLQSSLAASRMQTNPVEDNPLDLHQAFADIHLNTRQHTTLTFRVGRQELLYGAQRLVSVRDGPNNRQSFDGIKFLLRNKKIQADFFYSHYVAAKKKIFDDHFSRASKLWGLYYSSSALSRLIGIDVYFLGLWRKNAVFNDVGGRELRHSLGTRFWCRRGNWKWDAEAVYQTGSMADKNIAAWTASVNINYQASNFPLKPELGLKTEWISGDKKKADGKLQTFNPLFPRGAYFGLAALIGPANLFDVHPSVSLNLTDQFVIDLDYDVFWRTSTQDGIYSVNTSLLYSDAMSLATKIGRQLAASLTYRPNPFLYFRGEFTWFDAGPFLKTAGTGKDILFTGVTAQLKF